MSISIRRGMTLIELLITITIMGIVAGVATMGVRRIQAPRPDNPLVIVGDSLRRAVAEGRAITIRLVVDGHPAAATVNVDGSIVADSVFKADRLAGRTARAQ
jgi:prepilin-type N-terminal cleavage/methylation domain-containing protein